ncbi:glutamate-1-semialdehyde 2,1-aminomutase [Estrella lausannensis]|uniref:Glutamate-1-semialdehyde 2,1-aminomutase n=1 Tax=Estrella lausannensis TaxID=483423 RepID=A0A0H5DSS3_9BACT|nr:glutamate-1-semialdehyde 2,1-aminomutase [Estrella lausannensis]CRX39373.1 Glutamate-1-semialdehyde 2,1-aminomutase [Estrella lausannensis]
MKERKRSQEIFKALQTVIPGGVNSPVRSFKDLLETPVVAREGRGALLIDADGNEWIDYVQSWGALIHGHAHPRIVRKAEEQLKRGSTFGMTTEIEEKLARKIIERVPSVEKIRFVSSGTEATMSALRLARGFTKRDLIVKFSGNYHGHADMLLVRAGSGLLGMNATSSSEGVPSETVSNTVCLPFNDLNALKLLFRQRGQEIAAVIIEPVAGNMGVVPATEAFMTSLREETSKAGALLIFDEVMTGFRLGLRGAQSIYDTIPDITCFAKIIGGGFPAAAFGGRREIMDILAPLGAVYQAGTLSGNPVAMASGLEAILMTEEKGFYEDLERKARILADPVARFIEEEGIDASMQRVGSMVTLFFGRRSVGSMEEALQTDQSLFKRFFLHMLERGILIPPSPFEAWFISAAHEESHLIATKEAIMEFVSSLKNLKAALA